MKQKAVFYFTAFACGLGVMGVEMSASRLLSPYFGSTNIIWTVIICLIMIGLGAGSYLGGRLADRTRSAPLLYGIIAVSAVWIALLPVVSRPVILWTQGLFTGSHNAYLVAAVCASLVLFVPPLVALGMVSPYLAKLCVLDLSTTGTAIGRLSVYNTVGSILGSVLPAFVLIPTIGVMRSFLLFALALFLACAAFWLTEAGGRRRGAKVAALLVPLVCVSAFSSAGIDPGTPLYETESMYQYIRVEKESGLTILSTSLVGAMQTVQPDDPDVRLGIYTDGLVCLPVLFDGLDRPVRVLQIGYGGSDVSRALGHFFDNVDLTCVELDERIVEVARAYFGADPDDRVIIDDGRAFLQRTDETYDIIMIDAYQDAGMPVDLVTQEFFAQCRNHLTDGGMLAMNVAFGFSPDAPFSASLGRTLGSVFTQVSYVSIPGSYSALIFGADETIDFLSAYGSMLEKGYPVQLRPAMKNLAANQVEMPQGGELFTDDRSSAELLQMNAIAEGMRGL